INIRYSSINDVDPTFKVEIVVTGLLIVNSPSVSSWTESNALKPGSNYVDAYRALDAFGVWVRRMHTDLPLSDHWMLFTGFNIYTERNPIVAGLARLSSMCSLTSISIIEQDNTGSVGATAAHELGHSLGSLHDGEELDCFDDDNYVMSKKLRTPDNDIRASRPWQFSKCSIRAFKRFLSKVQCTNKSSRAESILSSRLSPGQVFSADQQCQLAFGNGSNLGRQLQYMEGYSTMCRRMYCSVPNVPGLYQAIFPFEKTSCGDRKWCQRGRCENHIDAPTMEDHCPQGDDPTAPCVQEDCPYYTPRTKIVYCCHTCRPQQRRPAVSDIFRISAVQRNQSPNSGLVNADQTTTTTPPLVSTESTTHESQDRTSVATEAFNDQDLTTAASQFVDTKDTSNVTNNAKSQNNKAKPQANETNPQANEANSGHSTPKVFSEITESSLGFPDESTRATTDSTSYVFTSETSPMTTSEILGGTKKTLLEPNTSKDLQDATTRSPSEQTPQVRVVPLGQGDGLKVDNIPRPNKTRVHQNISGDNIPEFTGEPLSSAGVTKTNNSGTQMQPANQETSYSPSRGNLALHLGLTPFNANLNSDLISNSVQGVNPESDIILNMIHKGVSILALAGDDTRADGVKLNIVSSVKEPAIEDGTVSKSNTSLTGSNAIVTENLPPDPRSDMTRTVVSPESNHISLAPSAHIPRLMATSFWPPATTPEPNYENSQKGSGILDETGYLVNSMSSSRLASTDSSLDKVLATSISLDPKLKLEKSPANSNIYSGVSSSVQKPVMMPSEFLGGSNPIRYALDKVSTLETPPATASSVEGVNAGPLLPFWEMPSQSLPESVHTNNMPDLANLNYRARWWNGVLAQRSHQALEVSDYAVNWPNDPTQTDARLRTRVASRLSPSGQASSSPTDSYIPKGHKVEIISFQPHLKRFLEEMASVDSDSSRFETPHLTTTDKPNVLLNCRFQCVFFRELVSPAVDRSDEFVNYLIRRLPVSNRIPAPSVNMNRVSDIGLRASLQRLVAR
ncbi:A disintegrin and metalloproteinase with thrombospondin motifs 7, partial [Biomphalaria glabrata]